MFFMHNNITSLTMTGFKNVIKEENFVSSDYIRCPFVRAVKTDRCVSWFEPQTN